jgi:hypothetical protein
MGMRALRLAMLVAALPAAAACAPMRATVADAVLVSATGGLVHGEVRSVDARRGRMQLRDGQGRTHELHFDRHTRVVYRQQQYDASVLARGDQVRVRVQRDRNGTAWADRVEVRTPGRDSRLGARSERVDGRVGRVEVRRGYFTLERPRTPALTVRTPPRMSSADARRFERLRRGDRVRVELRPLGRNQAELVRFR